MVNLNVLNIISTKANDRCGYKYTFCNTNFLFDFLKHMRVARANLLVIETMHWGGSVYEQFLTLFFL